MRDGGPDCCCGVSLGWNTLRGEIVGRRLRVSRVHGLEHDFPAEAPILKACDFRNTTDVLTWIAIVFDGSASMPGQIIQETFAKLGKSWAVVDVKGNLAEIWEAAIRKHGYVRPLGKRTSLHGNRYALSEPREFLGREECIEQQRVRAMHVPEPPDAFILEQQGHHGHG